MEGGCCNDQFPTDVSSPDETPNQHDDKDDTMTCSVEKVDQSSLNLSRRDVMGSSAVVAASSLGVGMVGTVAAQDGPTDEISGVVEDTDGNAVDGATVVAVPHDESLDALVTTTDANGAYSFGSGDLHPNSNLYHVVARDGTEADPFRSQQNYPFISATGEVPPPDSGVSRWEWEQDVTDSWGSKDGTDNTSAGFTTNSQYGDYAKSFDGVDDYVSIPTITEIETAGEGTLASWINTSDGSSVQMVTRTNDPDGQAVYMIYVDAGIPHVGLNDNVEGFTAAEGGAVADGSWHHVCGVIEPDTLRIYVDGTEEASASYGGNLRTPDTSRIGARPNGDSLANGALDRTDVYDKSLSSTEVSNLYNTGSIGG